MKKEKSNWFKFGNPNEIKSIVGGLLLAPSTMFLGGELWQSFLIESGISEQNIATYTSITQIASVVAFFLFGRVVDNLKNIIKAQSLFTLCKLPTFILFGLFCLIPDIDVSVKFTCVLILGIITTATTAMGNLCSYKLPYCTIEISRYGFVTGISGVLGNANGIVWSAIISSVLSSGYYFNIMLVFFGIGFFMTIGSAVIYGSLKEMRTEVIKKKDQKINLFKYPPFYWLIIPNLARGLHSGIYSLLVTLGYYSGILDAASTTYLVVIVNIAGMLCNILYSKICAKTLKNNRRLILISSIIVALLSPIAFIFKNPIVFLIIYGVCYIFYQMFCIAIPVAVTEIIDYQVAGQYSSGRLLLNSLGSIISAAICMWLVDTIGVILVLFLAGFVLILSGGGMYVVMNKME